MMIGFFFVVFCGEGFWFCGVDVDVSGFFDLRVWGSVVC